MPFKLSALCLGDSLHAKKFSGTNAIDFEDFAKRDNTNGGPILWDSLHFSMFLYNTSDLRTNSDGDDLLRRKASNHS